MKIYTEVNYEWKDGELVKTSSESFEYSGEISLCKGGGGGNVFKKVTDNLSNIPALPTPNLPTPNIPQPGGSFNDMGRGISLLTENVSSFVGDVVDYGSAALDKVAKASKEAWSGKGGYADDATANVGPGATGSEDATAGRTLLTGQRKVGAGRAAHVGSGSASNIS
jgi:hypothetical protein